MTAKSVLEYTKEMTLLYVEDDAGLRENTKLLFENFFLSVTTANDGQQGLDLYLQSHAQGQPYNMVISDINMPNMDGIAMGEAIFEKEPLQAFIFITAHNEVSFLGSALHMGVSGFLTKPIQNDLFLKTLYRLGQAFCDRRYFTQQYDATEKLNIELMRKNESLQKLVRLLDTTVKKEQIVANAIPTQLHESIQDPQIKIDQINRLLSESIHELKDLYLEIDTSNIEINKAIASQSSYDYELSSLCNNFQRYASILLTYHSFTQLSESISNLANTLISEPTKNQKALSSTFVIMESFIFLIDEWQKNIRDVNLTYIDFFNASIINDAQTLINVYRGHEKKSEC